MTNARTSRQMGLTANKTAGKAFRALSNLCSRNADSGMYDAYLDVVLDAYGAVLAEAAKTDHTERTRDSLEAIAAVCRSTAIMHGVQPNAFELDA